MASFMANSIQTNRDGAYNGYILLTSYNTNLRLNVD